MDTTDPNNHTNQKATSELLRKSKALKEKTSATMKKLDSLMEQSKKIINEQNHEKEK